MLKSLILLVILTTLVSSHSWVECTDYGAEINGLDYDQDECFGWIRGETFEDTVFAQRNRFANTINLGDGSAICRDAITDTASNDYQDDYVRSDKLASYTPGSTIRVVWPAKNHASAECQNANTDNGMKLYFNPSVDPTGDRANTASTMEGNGYTLVIDWQEGCTPNTAGCGFQNCKRYCEDTDAAVCFGDFVVPTEITTSGYYTFVWYWIFTTQTYTSCWEAYVDADSEVTTAPLDSSSGSENEADEVTNYILRMTVCTTGQTYDTSTFSGFVEDEFITSGQVTSLESTDIDYISLYEGSTSFNVTVQLSLVDASAAGEAQIIAENFCTNFTMEYSSTTCDYCSDIITYALYESAGHEISIFVAVIVSFSFSLLIL